MKKIFLALLLFPMLSFGQFTLTPNGLVDENTNEEYIVYEFPDKTSDELYSKILNNLKEIYRSPKEVITEIEGKSIIINAIQSDAICHGHMFGACMRVFDLIYSIKIDFKDGKIRINAPIISPSTTILYGKELTYSVSGGGSGYMTTFNKKGKLKDKYSKETIENFINNLTNSIIKDTDENNEDDNW